jgi:hypothetical protein
MFWSPGFWRLDDTHHAEKTTIAASAPPPPKVEKPPAQPASEAHWTPGYWGWDANARVWVWVTGAWRVPLP